VGRHDVEANRQPQSGAAAGAVARTFGTIKALAQPFQLFIADARGAVGKIKDDATACLAGADQQTPPLSV
jgi:hypothetical protein